MSKATLIEFWRGLILSDEALERFKTDRADAVARYDLANDERLGLINDDYGASYSKGVPVEIMFQAIILLGIDPLDYMRKLHGDLNYTGPGRVTAESAPSGHLGSYTR